MESLAHVNRSKSKTMKPLPQLMLMTLPATLGASPADTRPTFSDLPPPVSPLELIPVQEVILGEASQINLGLFFVLDACELEVSAAPPLEVAWRDHRQGMLSVQASSEHQAVASIHVVSRRRGGGETAEVDIPVRVVRQTRHEFRLRPTEEVQSLFVAGDFNGWSTSGDEMTDPDGDGLYTARISLEPGRHLYKFVLNGRWLPDPDNPERSTDGYDNSVLEIAGPPMAPQPRILRRSVSRTPDGRVQLTFAYDDGQSTAAPASLPTFHVYLDNRLGSVIGPDENSAALGSHDAGEKFLAVVLPRDCSAEHVRILGITGDGALFPEQLVLLNGGQPVGLDNPGDSWRATILYYAFVDRFANGDPSNDRPVTGVPELTDRANWQGGDLQGLLEKIEDGYFSDLGVNCLWLSPLNRQTDRAEVEYSPPNRTYTAYHGYWPVSQTEIEPRFGDGALLRRVVEAAHARGIRVILDFVAAHVHEDSPLFAEHRDWFGEVALPDGRMNIKLFDEFRLTTWFDTFLPRFDFVHSREALEFMTDNALWWLQTYDLDGFRQDATKHIPDEFWQTLTRKIRLHFERPRARRTYQVGETISERDLIQRYARGGMLDGQFDFPIYWPARDALALRSAPMRKLAEAVEESIAFYGPEPMHSALIGNHDTSRFMAYADGDLPPGLSWDEERTFGFENDVEVDAPESWERLGVAFACLFTLPHIPMVYYGDEIGMTGAQDPDNRRVMQFGDLAPAQVRLRETFSRLARLRREHPALWQGDFLTIEANEETWVYARANFDEVILVALNRADAGQAIEVALPPLLGLAEGTVLTDLLGTDSVTVGEGSTASFTMGPRSARMLHRRR